MNFFEQLLDQLKKKDANAVYTSDAVSPSGRRFSQDFELGAELGRGGYGFIKAATDRKEKRGVAVKLMEKQNVLKLTSEERGGHPERSGPLEFIMLASLNHSNIIQVVDWYEGREYHLLVLEYLPGVSLFDLIDKNSRLSEPVARYILLQVLSAISYLHSQGILHNDIKDENVMVGREGTVTLLDLGSATYETNSKTRNYCGSETYSSPEVVSGKPYSRLCQEIWSIGVLLFVMVSGEMPFDCVLDVLDQEPVYPPFLSQDLQNLLQTIFCKNPEARPPLPTIQTSTWTLGPVQSTSDLVFD